MKKVQKQFQDLQVNDNFIWGTLDNQGKRINCQKVAGGWKVVTSDTVFEVDEYDLEASVIIN